MGCVHSQVLPGSDSLKDKEPFKKNPNVLSGDVSKKKEAKHEREMLLKERQMKKTLAAEEFSNRIMDEKERLSLGTRSRGTSRATSRAGSPTPNTRKQVHFKADEVKIIKPTAITNTSATNGNNSVTPQVTFSSDLDTKHQNGGTINVLPAVSSDKKENSSVNTPKMSKNSRLKSPLSTSEVFVSEGNVGECDEDGEGSDNNHQTEKLATIVEREGSRCSSKAEKEVKRG